MNSQTVCIFGRQPELGLAELERRFGATKVQPIAGVAALVDGTVDINNYGGIMKTGELIGTISGSEWPAIVNYLADFLPKYTANMATGKLLLGLSLYGIKVNASKINAGALTIKKRLKSGSRGVRIVPNKQPELNTAQVLHNNLTGPHGIELLLVRSGGRTLIARTTAIQDIYAYAARDQKRPMRDAKVGMLPPKLAQIMLNLSGCTDDARVLDPFCGTGVVLQEAGLQHHAVYGTDLEERMIRYTRDNMNWLEESHNLSFDWFVEVGDATNHRWQTPFDTVVCETYLGRPLAAIPAPDVLETIINDCDTIHRKFLKNLASQTTSGFTACIAVPAWKTRSGFRHLKTLDSLEEIGYNRLRFTHVGSEDLIYHRPDQIVGRELVVLVRK